VAPDLPCEDDSAGLPDYANAVVEAIGDRMDLVVVAQSFGGFTAPLVCERVAVDLVVLVAPMVPDPGEAPVIVKRAVRRILFGNPLTLPKVAHRTDAIF